MKWVDVKSVLTFGGRDIKAGDTVPADCVKAMGSKRVESLVKAGKISTSKPAQKDDSERLELLAQAEELGLKPNARTGVEKLNIVIDKETERLEALETERLELLATVREFAPETADDVSTETLKVIISQNESN